MTKAPSPTEGGPEGGKKRSLFFAELSLLVSSVLSYYFSLAFLSPTLFNSLAFGLWGSEFSPYVLLIQEFNLLRLWLTTPEVFSSLFAKLLLGLNLFANIVVLRNMLQGVAVVPAQLSKSLKKVNIRPTLLNSTSITSKLASLLVPLYMVSRRGTPVEVTRNIRYAELNDVQEDLLKKWQALSPLRRHQQMLKFRGRTSGWLSLDVYALPQSEEAPLRPVVMNIHGVRCFLFWITCLDILFPLPQTTGHTTDGDLIV
jgi:hypothetical protein